MKLDAYLLSETALMETKASLYKPEAKPTKEGDPRIWFYGLTSYANADDMLSLTEHDGRIAVINLTQVDVAHVLDVQKSGPLWDILADINAEATSIADELLEKLRLIAGGGLVPSVMEARADTAIGRTLETALGIVINSAKEPDYKGIEIKSYRRRRGSRENRKTLFSSGS